MERLRPYRLTVNAMDGTLALEPVEDNLSDMLAGYGLTIEEGLVLDPQNQPFPVPIQRNVGGFTVTEIQALDYPPFVDVRPDGMNRQNPILAELSRWHEPPKPDPGRTPGHDTDLGIPRDRR